MITTARLAIFASGGGSNALKIIEYFKDHPQVQISVIICNNPHAGVISIAMEHNIPFILINKKSFYQSTQLVDQLRYRQVDWLILAGFLWLVPAYLIQAFPDHIVNIHPALLPKYGGKGMYGHHVHAAVKAAGESESGMTIHLVNEKYDQGRILFQGRCDLTPEDTAESIAAKVLKLEHLHYPRVIESLIRNDHSE